MKKFIYSLLISVCLVGSLQASEVTPSPSPSSSPSPEDDENTTLGVLKSIYQGTQSIISQLNDNAVNTAAAMYEAIQDPLGTIKDVSEWQLNNMANYYNAVQTGIDTVKTGVVNAVVDVKDNVIAVKDGVVSTKEVIGEKVDNVVTSVDNTVKYFGYTGNNAEQVQVNKCGNTQCFVITAIMDSSTGKTLNWTVHRIGHGRDIKVYYDGSVKVSFRSEYNKRVYTSRDSSSFTASDCNRSLDENFTPDYYYSSPYYDYNIKWTNCYELAQKIYNCQVQNGCYGTNKLYLPSGYGGNGSPIGNGTSVNNTELQDDLNYVVDTNDKSTFFNTLVNIFKNLVVPDSTDFLDIKVNDLHDNFTSKFAIADDVNQLVSSVQTYASSGSSSPPEFTLSYYDNDMSVIDFSYFSQYRSLIHGVILAIAWCMFLIKLVPRITRLISGGGSGDN